jgi:rhamnogalacturonan endolyase
MIICRFLLATALTLFTALGAVGVPQLENLSRGVVAVHDGEKVFVSWRLLGTEAPKTAFNVYRAAGGEAPMKLNGAAITDVTFFIDERPTLAQESSYIVRAVVDGQEQPESKPFKLAANAPARPYLSLPLQTPEGYQPNDASVGDLDGDGDYEIVLHQAGRAKDNSQAGETDPPILQPINSTALCCGRSTSGETSAKVRTTHSSWFTISMAMAVRRSRARPPMARRTARVRLSGTPM